MIKIVAKGIFYEDKIDEALKLYEELVIKSQKENGCISYNLFRDVNDKTILTMIEEWESREAHNIHKNTEHFTRIVPLVSNLRKSSELNIYELIL